MLRRRLPWLLALPLMVAGSIAAHTVGSVVAPTTVLMADGDGGEVTSLHERANSGYAGHAVMWIGLATALLAVVGIRGVLGRKRDSRGVGACCFFLLPVLAFTFQEVSERLLHAESFPFHAVFEPRFELGLALQLPFAAVAFFIAWLLLHVGKQLLRLLGGRPRVTPYARSTPLWISAAVALPRVRPLSRGHPLRGPPLLA